MMRWIAGACCALMLHPALADVPASPERELIALLDSTDSLSGGFSQQVRDESGEVLQEASGKLWLARPNQLRWATAEPYEYLLVTDGETLWRYDIDLEQINRQPLADAISATPAALLIADPSQIEEDYAVTRASGEANRFVLVPSATDSSFQRIELVFDGPLIQELQLLDSLDQRTTIVFDALERNQPIPAERFTFTPPPGVDVIADEP